MEQEDRNTLLLVVIILIVCVVSLIAIFNLIWGIIGGPISEAFEIIGESLYIQRLNYNFQVPDLEKNTPTAEETQEEITPEPVEEPVAEEMGPDPDLEYDYHFVVPPEPEFDDYDEKELRSFPDAIVDDAEIATGGLKQSASTNLRIKIPKIGVNSPVWQGSDAETLLEKGFWVYPGSQTLGEGEVIMLCHRRYFGPYDPRTCWNLNKVNKGDEIIMKYKGQNLTYKVVGKNVFKANDPLIYTISDEDDYIKISTCTPLYSNSHRLVVLAERVR